ncbi:3',5'-cyclic-nucleotide phosphodiesterase [Elasticomyces elasticus]|nr:3',5'-cyclic-nucleotide phosphodiesterase [Elasticomyces elasticus]
MDHGACNVVYVDNRARHNGLFKKGSVSAEKPYDGVIVCDSGHASLSKIAELDNPDNKVPTILLINIPYDEGAHVRGFPRDARTPSPTTIQRTTAENVEPSDLYGMNLLTHISSEIQQRVLSKLIIPVAVLSGVVSNQLPSALSVLNSPSLRGAQVLADPVRMIRYLDAGAVDVLTSPLSKDRVHGLAVHAYRMYKEVSREDSSFVLTKKSRKLSWVGVSEARPYAYLREAMVSNLMDGICNPENFGDTIEPSDFHVAAERRRFVEGAVGEWSFSAHEFTMDELIYGALVMLQHALKLPELEPWRISTSELTIFLMASRHAYNEFVLYHNFRHVIDVLQAIFFFLLRVGTLPPYAKGPKSDTHQVSPIASLLRPFDALTLLISAIGHDVGHPGVNNAFLVALNAPLAQLYNDRSVLESFHCAAYSQILRRYWPTVFSDVSMRKLMINSILATDMGLHFKYMADMGNLQEKLAHNKNTLDGWSAKVQEEYKELTCGLLIKCADISNVARKFDVAARWADILTDEFCNQGAMEKELDLPTCLFGGPPVRNDVIKMGESQIGFMNIFARPLFEGVTDILPAMNFSVAELSTNKSTWEKRIGVEKSKRGPLPKRSLGDSMPSPMTRSETSLATPRSPRGSDPLPPIPTNVSASRSPTTPTRNSLSMIESRRSSDGAQSLNSGLPLYLSESRRSSLGPSTSDCAAQRSSTLHLTQTPPSSTSRRSSKDVALAQLGSFRLGQLNNMPRVENQSFPDSRRGSTDASLTTILVTGQSNEPPRKKDSPSPTEATVSPKHQAPGSNLYNGTRDAPPNPAAARNSLPSSRSHATSSATANTTVPHSPSTEASSMADSTADSTSTPPPHHPSIPSTENPFINPNIPSSSDSMGVANRYRHTASVPNIGTPDTPEKSNMVSRVTTDSSDGRGGAGRGVDEGKEIRERRSRSRLGGLRFWRKRRKSLGGVEVDGSP